MKTTVVFGGGLGNQMFQYAFVLALRNKGHRVEVDTSIYNRYHSHNGYELEKVFGIKEPIICKNGSHLLMIRALYRLNLSPLVFIDGGGYHPEMLIAPKRFLYGYWQDKRYFSEIENHICQVFTFKNIDEFNLSMAKEMKKCHSVSIHIRRGDYKQFGMPLLGVDYYRKAVETIKGYVQTPVFYLFSDDTDEAVAIANQLDINFKVITHNSEEDSYKDMFLMTQCSHNIIANSSFSWWGAYLNQNPEKIVISR